MAFRAYALPWPFGILKKRKRIRRTKMIFYLHGGLRALHHPLILAVGRCETT